MHTWILPRARSHTSNLLKERNKQTNKRSKSRPQKNTQKNEEEEEKNYSEEIYFNLMLMFDLVFNAFLAFFCHSFVVVVSVARAPLLYSYW